MSCSSKLFSAVLMIAAGLYATMLCWSLPTIMADSNGLYPFDLRPLGYSYNEARTFLLALDGDGRHFYQNVQLRLDTAFPLFAAMAIGWSIYRLGSLDAPHWRRTLALIALPGMIFDYLENHAISQMLDIGGTDLPHSLVAQASLFSQLKAVFSTISLLVLLAALGLKIIAKRAGR